jgi:DNA-binding MarR family transcriptional regulator
VTRSKTPAPADTIRRLAGFRYRLRRFLRFSEEAARRHGLTPQQHQLMLGVAGFTGRGTATISELAEFLQEKNHSVVGLVERAADAGLVVRANSATDRRQVVVSLTARGNAILGRLSKLHAEELERIAGPYLLAGRGPVPDAAPDADATPARAIPVPDAAPAAHAGSGPAVRARRRASRARC